MTAKVIWSDGRMETLAVVAETAQTFTTDDANQTRWWKRTGMRIGAMRPVRVEFRKGSFWSQATASIIDN